MCYELIKIAVIFYVCYKLMTSMNTEQTIKFGLFTGLSILPIAFGLLLFDYSILNSYNLINDFGITVSLIAIALAYTGVSILIRIFMYSMGILFKDKSISGLIANSTFLELFYIACVDTFIYGAMPIVLTVYLKGNFIHFVQNSILIWAAILAWFVLWVFILRNKLKIQCL